MKGRVHSFQTLGALDGPGLRFVVFLQGCNLRCLYCHNPDTWEMSGGTEHTSSDILHSIERCRPYFGKTGGVTVSGGEPLLQAGFVRELFSLCRENGIHTCLDTSGQPMGPYTQELLEETDLCLLDIKATSDESYRALCGTDLQSPLSFLRLLEKRRIPTWIRQVIVPGMNDGIGDIEALKSILMPYSCIQKVELLPFQTLCLEKYRRMGIRFPLEHLRPMKEEDVTILSSHLTPQKQ